MSIGILFKIIVVALAVASPVAVAADTAQVTQAPAKPAVAKPVPGNAAECDKASRDWFAKAYAGGMQTLKSGRVVKASYKAQFSTKRKQCIVRLEFGSDAQGKAPAISTVTLYEGDPASRRSLGAVVRSGSRVVHCDIGKQKCQTVEEWQAKAAPLMAE